MNPADHSALGRPCVPSLRQNLPAHGSLVRGYYQSWLEPTQFPAKSQCIVHIGKLPHEPTVSLKTGGQQRFLFQRTRRSTKPTLLPNSMRVSRLNLGPFMRQSHAEFKDSALSTATDEWGSPASVLFAKYDKIC